MNRAALLVLPLTLAAALLAACDRTPRAASTPTSTSTSVAGTAEALATPAPGRPVEGGAPFVPTAPPGGFNAPLPSRPLAAPSSTPAPIPVAGLAQQPASPRARFVVRRGADLWIVSPGVPAASRRLVEGAARVTYGGTSTGGDLYLAWSEAGDAAADVSFEVNRVSLATNTTERLFTVDTNISLAISPDGSRLAYTVTSANYTEIRVLEFGKTSEALLVDDGSTCLKTSPTTCRGYRALSWSSDGRYLEVVTSVWEWSDLAFIDMAVGTRPWIRPPEPLGVARWHPSGPLVCGLHANDGLFWRGSLFDVRDGSMRQIDFTLPDGIDASLSDCGWTSPAEPVYLVSARRSTSHPFDQYVVWIGRGLDVSAAVLLPDGAARVGVLRTLPDGRGIALGERRGRGMLPPFFVLDRAGTLSPLDLEADEILDILPE